MSRDVSECRKAAARVARWLVSKERSEDAVALLCAWASRGPNDALGQELLAEALRIEPTSKQASQAFEHMEGMEGPHAELETARRRYDEAELTRLELELKGPTFRRAQMGFNNNVRTKGGVFHIQTEDSGLNAPHVITHLFADGGRIVKSHKRSYSAALETESDVPGYVRKLMRAQHLEMVFALRDGQFDEILAAGQAGGLELLEGYPQVDVDLRRRSASSTGSDRPKGEEPSADPAGAGGAGAEATGSHRPSAEASGSEPPSSEPANATEPDAAAPSNDTIPDGDSAQAAPEKPPAEAATPPKRPAAPSHQSPRQRTAAGAGPRPGPRRAPSLALNKPALYTLHVVRSLVGGPGRYAVAKQESLVGSQGQITLHEERFSHGRQARLRFAEGRLWLTPLEGENGVFLRIHRPTLMEFGEEFLVGDQLLRVEPNPHPDDGPDPGPTYFYSSPRWRSAFRVVQVLEGGAHGTCVLAHGDSLQVGSVIGDFLLGSDPLIDPQHCMLEEQAGSLLLTDLGSRTGVFVRVQGKTELVSGDEIVFGRTHLVVAIEQTRPR